MRQYFASDFAYGLGPGAAPAPLFIISPAPSGTGSQTYTVATATVVSSEGVNFSPLATNAPILLGSGAAQETVTPSAVTNIPNQQSSFTANVSNAHGSGTTVASGTAGLQEALNKAASQNGGAIVVDGKWASLGGTTAMLTAAANPTGSPVCIIDNRGAVPAIYFWNGTAFTLNAYAVQSPALASLSWFVNEENLTLSTSGSTTDTVGNLLPANSLILTVAGRVTTTITTATDWKLGDSSTAGRFSAADSTLTAGESVPKSGFPPVQLGTGIASATTGMYQPSAAKVRVTCTGTPGAGAIRITVMGLTIQAPQS